MPAGPWRELAMDWYGPVWGKYVLILIDRFSRYPLHKISKNITAKALMEYLEEVFELFGIPKRLQSDNGPPFQSYEFKQFCARNGIIHSKTTPYWPRANGLVELFMKNLSKCLKNSQVSAQTFEQELREFLKAYRATPHSST
jgi:transposase InsO family protein